MGKFFFFFFLSITFEERRNSSAGLWLKKLDYSENVNTTSHTSDQLWPLPLPHCTLSSAVGPGLGYFINKPTWQLRNGPSSQIHIHIYIFCFGHWEKQDSNRWFCRDGVWVPEGCCHKWPQIQCFTNHTHTLSYTLEVRILRGLQSRRGQSSFWSPLLPFKLPHQAACLHAAPPCLPVTCARVCIACSLGSRPAEGLPLCLTTSLPPLLNCYYILDLYREKVPGRTRVTKQQKCIKDQPTRQV